MNRATTDGDPSPGADQDALSSSEQMRRLQVGGMGLIAVLLMVSLASLVGSQRGANETAAGEAAAIDAATPPEDPLAELGAQPSTAAPVDPATEPATALPAGQAPAAARPLEPRQEPVVPDLAPDPALERERRQRG